MIQTVQSREADNAAIRRGVRIMLDRQLLAFDDFAAQIAEAGGITIAQANRVVGVYRKAKAIKYDGMRYVVKHGGFWDHDVILRALATVEG